MGIEIKTGRERNEGRDGGWKKTRMKRSGLFLENKKRGWGEVADLAPWRIFSIFSGYIAFVKKAVLPFRGTEVRREDIYIYIYLVGPLGMAGCGNKVQVADACKKLLGESKF